MKQLVSGDEALVTPAQHTAPCADCPWGRVALPGWLGSLTPRQWLAVAHSEALADCHTLTGPAGPHQCDGLATYRANVCKRLRTSTALVLPPDRVRVFATPAEFLNHHEGERT